MERLVSVKEAAVQLACCEASIWKFLRQGGLQRVKIGRMTRIRQQDLDACIRLGLQTGGR
ncbi:MAG: HTH17 domain-containing protein [Nitrospira sp.]|nr:MAG: HTH17 domain-containing protein [Nitrospira sp.]